MDDPTIIKRKESPAQSYRFEIGLLQKEASMDRSSFEANTGLTYQETTGLIDDWRSYRHVEWNRSLTTAGLIKVSLIFGF